MKGWYISMVDIIICSVIISLCLSIVIGVLFYFRQEKEQEEKIGMLESKVHMLEEKLMRMEDHYVEHMAKYH